MIVQVALSQALSAPLSYLFEGETGFSLPGSRVLVPLGRRLVSGWILDEGGGFSGRMKKVTAYFADGSHADQRMVSFARCAAREMAASSGILLDHSLLPEMRFWRRYSCLFEGREQRLAAIPVAELMARAEKGPFRLTNERIPASGQIEVEPGSGFRTGSLIAYDLDQDLRELADSCLAAGRSMLLLVPDVLCAAYWNEVIPGSRIYNSRTAAAIKREIWLEARSGLPGVIIGNLSALFLPFARLGRITVAQAGSPRYHGSFPAGVNVQKLALLRARAYDLPFDEAGACRTLRSAAAPAETVEDRRPAGPLPLSLIPLERAEKRIPVSLMEKLKNNLLAGRRTLVVLDRKREDSFCFCLDCRREVNCPVCSGRILENRSADSHCSSCGRSFKESPSCSWCRKPASFQVAMSLESLRKAVSREIQAAGLLVVSALELADPRRIAAAALAAPLTLATAAVVNPFMRSIFSEIIYLRPESLFRLDTFRAGESIFSQVAGMRSMLPAGGSLTVYSYFHFHYALRLLDQEELFLERELTYRRWFALPPFSNVYEIRVSGSDLRSLAARLRAFMNSRRGRLDIRRVALLDRKPCRGRLYGVIQVHASGEELEQAGLDLEKNIQVKTLAW